MCLDMAATSPVSSILTLIVCMAVSVFFFTSFYQHAGEILLTNVLEMLLSQNAGEAEYRVEQKTGI